METEEKSESASYKSSNAESGSEVKAESQGAIVKAESQRARVRVESHGAIVKGRVTKRE